MGRIDDGLALARRPDVIFAAFGDMMRVPGAHGSPLEHKARGLDVRIVYSPTDALKLARTNPDRHVMFFAIGFETTAPSTALTLMRARAEGIENFSVFCNHVTIIPAIRAILDSPDMRLDGFIGPGHVSTVIGCRPYEWIARDEGKPIVVSGLRAARPAAVDRDAAAPAEGGPRRGREPVQAGRAVGGQPRRAAAPWPRCSSSGPTSSGAGSASSRSRRSGIRDAFAQWDAERVFNVAGVRVTDPKAAQCGEVLKGVLKPAQCKLFGTECTPEHPVGALMVSSEGSCAAYYNYEHRKAAASMRISDPGLSGEAPADGASPQIRFRDPQIEMAHGAGGKARAGWSTACSRRCSTSPRARRRDRLGDAARVAGGRRSRRASPPTASSSPRWCSRAARSASWR